MVPEAVMWNEGEGRSCFDMFTLPVIHSILGGSHERGQRFPVFIRRHKSLKVEEGVNIRVFSAVSQHV
jgi:hypothetical protein